MPSILSAHIILADLSADLEISIPITRSASDINYKSCHLLWWFIIFCRFLHDRTRAC